MGVNRLITRGMGRNNQQAGNSGMISGGMGGFFEQFIEEHVAPIARRIVKTGRSARDSVLRDVDRIIIWARLAFINDEPPPTEIKGSTSTYMIRQHGSSASPVSIRTKDAHVVTAERVKRYLQRWKRSN